VLTFGVELETVNRTRMEIAQALKYEFGGYIQLWTDEDFENASPEPKFVGDEAEFLFHFNEKGRTHRWPIVDDESLRPDDGNVHRRAEVVLGPLLLRDLEYIRRVCKTLLIAGAKSNPSCGLHVHFSAAPFDGKSLRRLVGLTYMYEPILYRALQVDPARAEKYCKPIHEGFAREVLSSSNEPLSITQKWYECCGNGMTTGRFDPVRYYGLNLNPEPLKNHYELRYFNGTLDPDTVLSYAHLAFGLLRFALKRAPAATLTEAVEFRRRVLDDPACHYREFNALLRKIGLGSGTYARSRDLFLKNL
jgi:hypothetical protein